MRNRLIEVHPMGGAAGAELSGVDLATAPTDAVYAEIRAALNEYGVIFFRDQKLTNAQYVAFGQKFGELIASKFIPTLPDFPLIAEIRKEADQTKNVGGNWHTDNPYREVPPMGTILLARQVPDYGGDTCFIHMGAAYDALSDGLKRTLASLRGVHSNAQVYGRLAKPDKQSNPAMINLDQAAQETTHPVVVSHPETGRKVLFVSPSYTARIDGWTEEESRPLLHYLFSHAQKPEFQCRFRWREGSIAFWDDRQTLHYAVNDYQGERRLMHRLMVAGLGPLN
jgi:taurine dioxygenase